MCTYSMIMRDWMTPGSPNEIPLPGWPPTVPPWNPAPLPGGPYVWPPVTQNTTPNIIIDPPKAPPVVTPDIAKLMLEILEKIDKLDKKLNRQDCLVDEESKAKYQKILRKLSKTKCPCKKKKAKKKTAKRAKSNKTILADNGGPVLLVETTGDTLDIGGK